MRKADRVQQTIVHFSKGWVEFCVYCKRFEVVYGAEFEVGKIFGKSDLCELCIKEHTKKRLSFARKKRSCQNFRLRVLHSLPSLLLSTPETSNESFFNEEVTFELALLQQYIVAIDGAPVDDVSAKQQIEILREDQTKKINCAKIRPMIK